MMQRLLNIRENPLFYKNMLYRVSLKTFLELKMETVSVLGVCILDHNTWTLTL